MEHKRALAVFVAAGLALAACTNPDGSPNQIVNATTIGAATGAVAGNAIGGDSRGTLAGGLAGASAGLATGAVLQGQQRRY